MRADRVSSWLDAMRSRGLAVSDEDAADQLGVSIEGLERMKGFGTGRRNGLAMAALIAGLKPWGSDE